MYDSLALTWSVHNGWPIIATSPPSSKAAAFVPFAKTSRSHIWNYLAMTKAVLSALCDKLEQRILQIYCIIFIVKIITIDRVWEDINDMPEVHSTTMYRDHQNPLHYWTLCKQGLLPPFTIHTHNTCFMHTHLPPTGLMHPWQQQTLFAWCSMQDCGSILAVEMAFAQDESSSATEELL